ncbi:VanZ family protein [Microbacterium bovistercoris]|uniref:VanZ family protein n=1 Tax=Microbacterium bovistercoris TaxID=2293570 RepID=A0A371NZA6_9MICO|nr:VanZ family protein [Microbacterium bovistercoris]REJ08043.1 VanZ family protein [Microbacterium bovistercoris]
MTDQAASACAQLKQHPLLASLLGVCLLGAVAVVFLPIGWALNRFVVWLYYFGKSLGAPAFVGLEWYDAGLNMLLFAVPAALAALIWSRVPRWAWVLAVLAGATAIELVQFIALPRDASVWDVVANTAGAAAGILLVLLGEAIARRARR